MVYEGGRGESRLRVRLEVFRCLIPSYRGCVGRGQDLEDFLFHLGFRNREFGVVVEVWLLRVPYGQGRVPFGQGRQEFSDRCVGFSFHEQGEKGRDICQHQFVRCWEVGVL